MKRSNKKISKEKLLISVIIPSYNEEECIEKTLAQIPIDKAHEVIVVDGASEDNTVAKAKKYTSAVYVTNKRGRSKQMNLGAKYATGNVYVFLHADTLLPQNAFVEIKKALLTKRSGRFRVSFLPSHPLLKFYAFFTRFQYFSYGDQSFFVIKEIFLQLKGFDEDSPFEDIDFYKRLKRIERPYISKKSTSTSSRRFFQMGIIKQATIDFIFILMIQCKFPNNWIHQFKNWVYRDLR